MNHVFLSWCFLVERKLISFFSSRKKFSHRRLQVTTFSSSLLCCYSLRGRSVLKMWGGTKMWWGTSALHFCLFISLVLFPGDVWDVWDVCSIKSLWKTHQQTPPDLLNEGRLLHLIVWWGCRRLMADDRRGCASPSCARDWRNTRNDTG